MAVGFFVFNKIFTVPRPRIILVDDAKRMFFVKHWGSRRTWSIPGGGAKKGESAEDAARRELREEIGVEVTADALEHVTTVVTDYRAPIFVVAMEAEALPTQPFNRQEIVDTGWFHHDQLPAKLTIVARLAIEELVRQGRI